MALPLLVNPGGWPIKHLAYAAARLVNAPRGAGAKRRPRYPDANWPPPCPRTTADRSILAMVRLGLSRGGGGIPSRRRQQRPGDARFCISSLWSNSAGAKEKKKHNGVATTNHRLQRDKARNRRQRWEICRGQGTQSHSVSWPWMRNSTADTRGGPKGHSTWDFFFFCSGIAEIKNQKIKTEIMVMRMTERRGFCGEKEVIVRIWFDGCTGCGGDPLSDIKAGCPSSIPSIPILPTQSHLRSTPTNQTEMSPSTATSTTSATPVVSHTHCDDHSCVNQSSPQCCHCGWRGSHSPQCPFK